MALPGATGLALRGPDGTDTNAPNENLGQVMRTAVVTGDYYKPGQTMVNRHIEHLFGGNTCVIANAATKENPFGKAVYARRQIDRSLVDLVTSPLFKGFNRVAYGTSRIPVGERREALIRFLKDQNVEVMLAEFGTECLGMADIAELVDIPCFCYFRGADASYSLQQGSRIRGYRRMFPKLTGVFAVSQFLLDNLARHGIAHANSHVVPSGVNVERFQPGDKQPRSFCMIGRMVEKKSPLLTIRAFLEAAGDTPDAHLTVVGSGPLLEPARALVAQMGGDGRVEFTGALPHEEVRAVLARSEVFLQHSVTASDGNTEGLPTSIQEALASGCVVISTRHAGIPEAVEDGLNGWLVDEHDAAGFTRLIGQALAADTSAMTAAARQSAIDRFDNAKLLTKVEDVIRSSV